MNSLKTLLILTLLSFQGALYSQDKQPAPNAEVQTLDGQTKEFNKILEPGKYYVVSFWATWCVPCKKELSNMHDMAADWKSKFNTEVIAVSTDDSRAKSKVKSYVMGEKWPYIILLDQNQDLMRSLGIQQIPFTMIIDGKGNIVYKHSSYVEGDEYEIENKLMELISSK